MDKKQFFYSDEINVRIILLDVLKNIWLAVLAAIVVCVGFFAYENLLYRNTYTTEATFVVSPRSNGAYVGFYSSLSTANEMAEVFKEVFSSDVLKRLIKEDLQKPDLSFTIKASVAEGTNILVVSAQSDSPSNAHAVIQSVMENYRQVSGYLFGGVVLDVLKKPQINITPSNPLDSNKIIIMGVIFAVFGMVSLVALISVLRPTTKTIECAKRRMEENPLGVLRKERRIRSLFNKTKQPMLITDAGTSFRYKESLLQVAHKIRQKMQKDGMKILLVTSVAENEGKSTFAANMVLALARHGHKVAYVDMDLRKPAGHKIFSHLPQENLISCLNEGLPASLDKPKKLHIISNNRPSGRADKILHSEELARLLKELREKVDFVVLDSSPYTATADTGMLLQHADCCVMVMRQDWASYRVCRDVADDLREDNAEYLGYVINQYENNVIEQTLEGSYGTYGYYGKSYTEE